MFGLRCKGHDVVSNEVEEDRRGMEQAHLRDWADVFLLVGVILVGLELVYCARGRRSSFDGNG
jgi:hypothetical protein